MMQSLKANLKLPLTIEVDWDIKAIVKQAIEEELAIQGRTSIIKQFTTADENVLVEIPKGLFPMVGIWASESGEFSFQTATASIREGEKNNSLIFNNANEIEGFLIILF